MVAPTSLPKFDPTFYPVEDDVGEHELQTYILEFLRPLLERYLASIGMRAHVGSDQFIYWREFAPTCSVSPDIYVLPGVSQDIAIESWKVWETQVVPSFALEIVTSDYRKDYDESPKRYAELGVQELVIFDPFPGPQRTALQVFRQTPDGFQRIEKTSGDRVRSEVLGCFFRVVGDKHEVRLRVGLGTRGDELFPSLAESEQHERRAKEQERQAKEQERQAKEQERQAKEQERQAKEQERQAKEQALARVAELELELAKLRGQ